MVDLCILIFELVPFGRIDCLRLMHDPVVIGTENYNILWTVIHRMREIIDMVRLGYIHAIHHSRSRTAYLAAVMIEFLQRIQYAAV